MRKARTTVYIKQDKYRVLRAHLLNQGISFSEWVDLMIDRQLKLISQNQLQAIEEREKVGN